MMTAWTIAWIVIAVWFALTIGCAIKIETSKSSKWS